MKIFMRNIGMTLHVIHKLREQGITNVKVNMDWQHLIMNGESLGEYAAMLAAEGLLGHQHANSGWGTFDDDNMVGATAFMETLELALELRRAGYGENGERLGFDLYPYTEDAVAAVRRSVLQWQLHRRGRRAHRRRRAARGAGDQGRRPRLRAGVRGAGRPVRLEQALRSSRRSSRGRPGAGLRLRRRLPRRARRRRDHGRRRARHAPQRAAQGLHGGAERRDARRASWPTRRAATRPSSQSFDPFFTFFRGGVAAFEDGRRVGAVGVSGLPGEDDEALAVDALLAAGLELR